MKTGQTEHITATIGGPETSAKRLMDSLPTGRNRDVAAAGTPISPKMRMTLKSADFDITPLSSEEQIVDGATATTWEWDIIPKHSGKLRLHLASIVEVKNLSKDYTTIDREIAVQVDAVDAITAFAKANWPWTAGAICTLAAAIWGFFKRPKKDQGLQV